MLLRYALIVPGAILDRPPVQIQYDDSGKIMIEMASQEGVHDPGIKVTAILTSSSIKHEAGFQAMEDNVLPATSSPQKHGERIIQPGESLEGIFTSVPLEWLPESFRSFLEQIQRDLSRAVRRTWHLVHWRYGVSAGRSTFVAGGFEWSRIGIDWRPVPRRVTGLTSMQRHISTEANLRGEIESMLRSGLDEPLAYDLLQEALDIRHANTRASLSMVVASLEIGVKAFVARLVPEAKWLVEEAPSPNVVAMLRDYLPLLPVRYVLDPSKAPSIPPRLLTIIRNAIQKRNRLMHVGVESVDAQFLAEVFNATESTLRILDFYTGQYWSLDYLDSATVNDLGLEGAHVTIYDATGAGPLRKPQRPDI